MYAVFELLERERFNMTYEAAIVEMEYQSEESLLRIYRGYSAYKIAWRDTR